MSLMNAIYLEDSVRRKLSAAPGEFDSRGCLVLPDFAASRRAAWQINGAVRPESPLAASVLHLTALLNRLNRSLITTYLSPGEERESGDPLADLLASRSPGERREFFAAMDRSFPPGADAARPSPEDRILDGILLHLLNRNPACAPAGFLFPESALPRPLQKEILGILQERIRRRKLTERRGFDLIALLLRPAALYPDSLEKQVRHILEHWTPYLSFEEDSLLSALDFYKEEHSCRAPGPGPVEGVDYSQLDQDYANFSPDSDWMPHIILLAKNAFVWLDQLSRKYRRPLATLRDIPDEELNELADRGITGLWLIGLWERSRASKKIKRICGNPEAEASAYSLLRYDIAEVLGGWEALDDLKERCLCRGIRLASDMVPNHTGMDSDWVRRHPEYFIGRKDLPFPSYRFDGPDLSEDEDLGIYLEDGYYDQSDAAVVFKREDRRSGEVRYLYHGNDGTSMPWNDTAQLDFLNPEVREEVIRQILHVAEHFPIIRFDAAMTLARKHIQRLWYPRPGKGGAVPSRSECAMSEQALREKIPEEFWREVVDRIAAEKPGTLLLAEAFWMMEGYFVRNLGMHRVYNSAFMNLLKQEENREFRRLLKETLNYDPKILKRFVNFMNNPDEDTADAQFGRGDKYFGICTLMTTLPGLPMIGHGQFEGYREKYGMEYKKAYWEEAPDQELIARHDREIVPLMKRRMLFAGAREFHLFDFLRPGGVDENVYAFANAREGKKVLVLYNNSASPTAGEIRQEVPKALNTAEGEKIGLRSLSLPDILDLKDQAFTLLFDMKERLWYIRRNRDILRKGLAISLEGYQSRVYFPILQREDDGKKSLEKLVQRMGDAGIPHLERAIKHSELEPVIYLLREFFGKGIIDTPVMADLVASLATDMNRIRKILPRPNRKGPRRPKSPFRMRMEAVIIPAVQALQLAVPCDRSLFQMARFYEDFRNRAGGSSPNPAARFAELMRDPSYAEWFGINEYRGVLWYNRERTDEALWWISALEALELLQKNRRNPDSSGEKAFHRGLNAIRNALAESSYRVERVLEALAPRV